MSYMDFREDFLTEVEARLAAVDVAASTNSELLANGALYKMAASVAEAEQIGASTLSTIQSMDTTQLQTWLTDVGNLAAFNLLLSTSAAFSAALSSASVRAAIFGSAAAMNSIISSKTALDYIFGDAVLFAEFTASSALTATSIPTMTGPSTPSGLAESSSNTSGREAYRAFDKSLGGINFWLSVSSGAAGQWIQYTFPSPVFVYKATLTTGDSDGSIKDFKLEYETPKGFVEAVTGTLPRNAAADFVFTATGKHSTWRITCLSTQGTSTSARLFESDLFGLV